MYPLNHIEMYLLLYMATFQSGLLTPAISKEKNIYVTIGYFQLTVCLFYIQKYLSVIRKSMKTSFKIPQKAKVHI